jgi:hypothetical protein
MNSSEGRFQPKNSFKMKKRDSKRTFKHSGQLSRRPTDDHEETRLRKAPKRFACDGSFDEDSEMKNSRDCDLLGRIKEEKGRCFAIANPAQVSFERKVLELLSKCREFCPKIYSKLERLATKAKTKLSDSRTGSGIIDEISEQGKFQAISNCDKYHRRF